MGVTRTSDHAWAAWQAAITMVQVRRLGAGGGALPGLPAAGSTPRISLKAASARRTCPPWLSALICPANPTSCGNSIQMQLQPIDLAPEQSCSQT